MHFNFRYKNLWRECDVSTKVQEQYNKQVNKNGTKNQNLLEIQTTFKNPNTHRAIIPGSSIKGMLDTVMKIYPAKIKENDIRQNLILSDASLLNGSVEIGYANRRHRDSQKSSKDGIYQIIEVIKPNSKLIFTIDSKIDFESIKNKMKEYHNKRYNSRYEETQKSFIARVGKNVGMDYVVEVDNVNDLRNKDKKPLATHFLYDSNNLKNEEFGWIKVEIITDKEYAAGLDEILKQEQKYYQNKQNKQKETIDRINQEKEKYLKLKEEKEYKKS